MIKNLTCSLFALCLNAACLGFLDAQEVATRKEKYSQGEMELFDNSSTLSQSIAMNNVGSILGTREIPDKSLGLLLTVPFYSGIYGTKDIPTPEKFTHLEPVAICDSELVIAYATRPSGNNEGSLSGVLWNPKNDSFVFLPKSIGDSISHPQAVSADGKRITGYSTGPDRLRPTLWEYQQDTQQWTITILPTIHQNNPYLMSSSLRISPDGKLIAGCCTEAFRPDGTIDSALYTWTQSDQGTWQRSLLSTDQLYLRGINDQGEMAGSIPSLTGERQPCYVSPKGEFQRLELLPGDVSGEAKGINNASRVIGFSDDPPGTEGGPEPCYWGKDRKVQKIAPSGSWYGMIQAINEAGQMAGLVEDSQSGATHAFRTLQ